MLLSCFKCFTPYHQPENNQITFDEYNYSASYLIINGLNSINIPSPSQPSQFLILLRKINNDINNQFTFELISDNLLNVNNNNFKRYFIRVKNNKYDIYNLILSFTIQNNNDQNPSIYIRCTEGHIYMRTLTYWIKIKDIFTKNGYSVAFKSNRF